MEVGLEIGIRRNQKCTQHVKAYEDFFKLFQPAIAVFHRKFSLSLNFEDLA